MNSTEQSEVSLNTASRPVPIRHLWDAECLLHDLTKNALDAA